MKEIYSAISKAQQDLTNPPKDKEAVIKGFNKAGHNYEKRYKYSDIATILSHVRPALAKQGLALIQPLSVVDGKILLITKLIHSSGESVESQFLLHEKATPQEFGSALTYARRYAICALLAIAAEEDDDGELASKEYPKQKPFSQQEVRLATPLPHEPSVTKAMPQAVLDELGKNVLIEGNLKNISVKAAWQYRSRDAAKLCSELRERLNSGEKLHPSSAALLSYGDEKGLAIL